MRGEEEEEGGAMGAMEEERGPPLEPGTPVSCVRVCVFVCWWLGG